MTISTTAQVNRGSYPVEIIVTDEQGLISTIELTVTVMVPGHNLVLTMKKLAVTQASPQSYAFWVASVDGYAGNVSLNITSSNTSIVAGLSATSVTLVSNQTVPLSLTLAAPGVAAGSTSLITITATSGNYASSLVVEAVVTNVDIIPVSVSSNLGAVASGGTVVLSTTIQNAGVSTPLNDVRVGLYLSTDSTITSNDTKLGSYALKNLLPGSSRITHSTVHIPVAMPSGSYYLGVIADDGNVEAETNEANNAYTSNILAVVEPSNCPDACSFALTSIDINTSLVPVPMSVNNDGTVVGYMRPTTSGPTNSFFWSANSGLTLPNYYHSFAYAIANNGDIGGSVASSNRSGQNSPFVWRSSSPSVILNELGQAFGVNEMGYAVGYSYPAAASMWNLATKTITRLNAEGITTSYACAINDSQIVSGGAYARDNTLQAYVYDTTSGMRLLGIHGVAVDVNNINEIAVSGGRYMPNSWFYNACTTDVAVSAAGIYTEASGMRVLPGLTSNGALAVRAVNNRSQVVGTALASDGQYHAVIWINGKIYDLNDLIAPYSGWLLQDALSISENGKIVGIGLLGTTRKLFILNPQSTPIVKAAADVCASGCPFSSIQAALNTTRFAGTVLVGSGVYNESIVLKDNKTVKGLNGPASTIIDATGLATRVAYMEKDAIIDGVTLRGGQTTDGAGVYLASGGRQIIKNSIIRDNVASSVGGGVSAYGGSAIIENTLIVNNQANTGAGITSNANILVRKSTIADNNALSSGGGLSSSSSTGLRVENSVFSGNRAGTGGGAISTGSNWQGQFVFVNNLIYGNTAPNGSAVFMYRNTQIINSTIADNLGGNGVYMPDYSNFNSITNSIVWGNAGGNIVRSRLGVLPVTANTLTDTDPLFVNRVLQNYRLGAGSPAIDTGKNTSTSNGMSTDLDGNMRGRDGDNKGTGTTGDGSDYDIGAYEY